MEKKETQWSSNYAFILAAIGSAVGLGNIWRFPYIMGQNGGAVFLVTYLTIILTVCFIALISEIFVGKFTKKEPVTALESIKPAFKWFGWLGVVTVILIASFYFVVGGWILNYIFLNFTSINISDYGQYFQQFVSQPVAPIILAIMFLTLCAFFVYRGINKGIEFANKIMMPIFAIILIMLVIFSINLPNSNLGLEFMFKPDFTKFNGSMILTALGQALFTLSIGMGVILTYGSYMKDEDNVVKSTYTIIIADTMFALLAGVMIFPAVFSYGLQPTSGPGLVFITLPKIFEQMPCGIVVQFLFFILLLFAALTSGISMLEGPTATFMKNFKITREKAVIIISSIVGFLSIFNSLSFGKLSNISIFGKTIFDFTDSITSNYCLPLGTLAICIIVGWFMQDKLLDEFKNKYVKIIVKYGVKYVVPFILLLCLVFLQFLN